MNYETIVRTQQLKRRRRIKTRLKRVVMVLACVVVFCTTYALILPAITSSTETFCGAEEHMHTVECYEQMFTEAPMLVCDTQTLGLHVHSPECWDGEHRVICGMPDFAAHEHNELCYGEDGTLICVLPERTTHVHTNACYRVVIDNRTEVADESHTHGDDCYTTVQGELICTIPEAEGHGHDESCYALGETLLCTEISEEHVHEDSCYESVLQCTTEEAIGHTHGEECFASVEELICDLEESPSETVPETEDDSYEVPAEQELICGQVEAQVHIHGDDCFRQAPQVLTCILEEDGTHIHNELCYGVWELRCEKEEHAHAVACYSNPEADLEAPEDWEKSFAEVEFTGIWQQDVLAIARTQLGYTESEENYLVAASGVQKGYTRYGQWYGDPHGDWCAMFVSFCMHYGGVEGIPIHSGCVSWIRELEAMNLYRKQGTYRPDAGDIIFFDWESDGLADHVGLVSELKDGSDGSPAELITLEGNSSNRVQYVSYDPEDTRIAGYGQLSRNRLSHTYCGLNEHTHDEACYDESDALLCDIEEHSHSEACNSYKVVYYDNILRTYAYIDGVETLPADLSLKVTPILREEDPHTFDSMAIALSEKMANSTEYMGASAFYRLTLMSQGQPYDLPEEATVRVEMSFHQPVFTAEQLEESNGAHTYFITEESAEMEVPVVDSEGIGSNGVLDSPNLDKLQGAINTNSTVSGTESAEGLGLYGVDGSTAVDVEEFDGAPVDDTVIYHAEPAQGETLTEAEAGITGATFRSGEIGTIAFALTKQTVSGTFWERVHSTSEITSGGTYMIVSAEGNFALTGNATTNYRFVTLETVKGNEKYYVIPESSDANLHWTFTGSGSSFTMQNKGSSRYLYLSNSSFISTNSTSNSLEYQSAEHTWYIGYRRSAYSSTYRLQNAGTGAFSRGTASNNQTDMLIFKLSDVTSLDVPADITDGNNSGTDTEGNFQMPDYDDVIDPSGSKEGETSLTGAVGSSTVTIKGQYSSDPSTADIERQYQEESYADHEANDGKVMSDKSVIYMADDYGAFKEYAPNTFSVALSTMAQEYKVSFEEEVRTPIDVVFVLDVSGSMATEDTTGSDPSRIVSVMKATNKAIKQIMDDHPANRVGISIYTGGAWELLPLDRYKADGDQYLDVTGADTPDDTSDDYVTYTHKAENRSISARFLYGSASLQNEAGKSYANVGMDAVQGLGTYTQAGIAVGRNIFAAIGDDTTYTTTIGTDEHERQITLTRQPVIILLSDGEPTYSTNIYMDPLNGPHYGDGSGLNHNENNNDASNAQGIHGYYTVLTANYVKRMVAIQYQKSVLFYSVGIGINDKEAGDGPKVSGSHTGDNYKRAVLDPIESEVVGLTSDGAGEVDPVLTADQMRKLMLGQYEEQWVKVVYSGWEEVELGVPHYYLPVLAPNPYSQNYSYADMGFFGNVNLDDVFSDIIAKSLQASPYGFVLYKNSAIDLVDNIGAGMEIKGDPILRYNGINYTHTGTSVEGNVTNYFYSYIHKDPYIPKHQADLSEIKVTLTHNTDGTQSVTLYVPDDVLPTYTPELTAQKDYYEMLPVRLIYQVGLTAESEARVLALQETGGELIFYTNKWNAIDDVARSTLIPSDKNPYYNDLDPNDGIDQQYKQHNDPKADNTTATRDNVVDCYRYTDTEVDNRTRIAHYFGNNGKLAFSSQSTEIEVEKKWSNVNADIMNPVTVVLYRVTEAVNEEGAPVITGVPVKELSLDNNSAWKGTFKDIALPDGEWYYAIAENYVAGYQAFYQGELVTFAVDNTPVTGVKVDMTNPEQNTVIVTNAPAVQLPSTGGSGTTIYTMGGCFLVAAAGIALMYIYPSKRRKGDKAHT